MIELLDDDEELPNSIFQSAKKLRDKFRKFFCEK
jgi:hypothetical protein